MNNLPKPSDLVPSVLHVINASGGRMKFPEIRVAVVEHMGISSESLQKIRSGNRTEFQYRLSWALTKAKGENLIKRSDDGTWEITPVGLKYLN